MENTNKMQHILIKFKDEVNADEIKNLIKEKLSLEHISTKKKFKHSKAELLTISEDDKLELAMKELNNHPDVHYAQPDYILKTCTDESSSINPCQWGLLNLGQGDPFGFEGEKGIDININPAWKFTKGSESVTVAVIDTGVDINHIDLKKNIYCNLKDAVQDSKDDDENGFKDDVNGWDFYDGNNSVFHNADSDLHGTFVAGIIGASGEMGGTIGVAPGIKILPLKFMDNENGRTSAACDAIDYAKAMGIKIVNCSWGHNNENPALKHHMEDSGMLFICAAGNDGENVAEKPFYPACIDLPNIISVAAINNCGKLWKLSNYGSKVHVAAPGVGIMSTVPQSSGKDYDYKSGTSFATPFVSGLAALILSMDKTASIYDIKDRILKNAKKIPQLSGNVSSGGIIDAYNTLKSIKA